MTVEIKPRRDHLTVFQLLLELDFPLGKKLIVQVLRGEDNPRIKKLELDKKIHHGSLGGYEEDDLLAFLDFLIKKDYLEIQQKDGRYSVVVMSEKGREETIKREKTLRVDDVSFQTTDTTPDYKVSPITAKDRKLFTELDFFLGRFTDEQKKAIIDLNKRQLCIAGAGSGKTSVLTHKIAYLVKFCGVNPKEILAITFTRKARQEMIERLKDLLNGEDVSIETFNSFSEKELLRKGARIYDKNKRMANSREFLNIVLKSINDMGYEVETFLEHYFEPRERRGKEARELFFSFMYDFRAILDSYVQGNGFDKKLSTSKLSEKVTAQNLLKLAAYVNEQLEEQGLRTFSDQIKDVIKLYDEHSSLIKKYTWILVDEYQDVNGQQVNLLDLLNPEHLFVVGDPRQSIYAWRGSLPKKIYEFMTEGTMIVELTSNFRSAEKIVSVSNVLTPTFTPLKAANKKEGEASLMQFASDEAESIAVVDQIKELKVPRNEVFVLSRTNRGLEKIEEHCKKQGIKYLLRTEEKNDQSAIPANDEITISTVHAIKGLEAEVVFVIGASMNNYPCKAKDHRFVNLLAPKEDYDQYEEERRLFYVACTRAKTDLRISYTGAPSPFLAKKVVDLMKHHKEKQTKIFSNKGTNVDLIETQRSNLRRWRYLEAQERNIPPYMIFSDRAMEHLLELQPLTVEELNDISGLGPAKIREFGEEILQVMYR